MEYFELPSKERETTIENGSGQVIVSKVRTRKGARMEIEVSGDVTSRLDALALESLSWQDPKTIGISDKGDVGRNDRDNGETELFGITNEFAEVEVWKLTADNSTYIQVRAPKLGYSIELDKNELVWLAEQPITTFSTFLKTSYPE